MEKYVKVHECSAASDAQSIIQGERKIRDNAANDADGV